MSHHTTNDETLRNLALVGLGVPALVLLGLRLYTALAVRRAEATHPPRGQFVTVDDLRLHYVSKGAGTPVIFIHGDGGSVYDFTISILPQAATEYRAMAFDRPGFGYSAPAPWGYTLANQARALNAGFNALGIESPILVGHSRGGSLVLAYAQLYPDEVGGVVDLAGRPYPAGTSVPLHFRALAKPVLGPVVAHTVAVPFGRPGVISGLNLAFEPEGAPPPAYLDAYMAMALRPQHLLAFAQDITGARTALRRLAPEYASMDVPLVMVHGTEDRNVSVAQSRRLAQEAPDATLIEVPGAGHELMFWHPDAVMQAIDMLAR